MSEKISLARIKKHGMSFEISVDPDKAVSYKEEKILDVNEVILADNIFTDVKRGLATSSSDLDKAFGTTDINVIADIIIKKGEIQLTSEHRTQERDKKRKKLVHLIHIQAVDPKTNLPHPENRIEAALEEAKINLADHKTIEEQFDEIISKLRPIIPIKIEKKELTIIIPAQYSGKAYSVVKGNSTILRDEWLNDGGWKVIIEIPAGLWQDFIDKINSLTHGEAMIEEKK